MMTVFRAGLCGTFLSLLCVYPSYAENGAIGYARPATGIVVDGDLSDWPDNAVRHPIETPLFEGGPGWRDKAAFRAAYDPSGDYLYLSVEVADESALNLPEGGLTDEDTLVIYLDAHHSVHGSSAWEFRAELDGASNISDSLSWDPQTGRASNDHIDMVVDEADGMRVYEWRIRLDRPVRAGMSIGLDMILLDVDDASLENPMGVIGWGTFGNKTQRAGRLGDLLLLSQEDTLGVLSGNMVWADGVDGPDLGGYSVRIRDRNDPELWVGVVSNETGRFSVELPGGEYCITPAFLSYGPVAEFRIKDDVEVCADVLAGAETRAETLVKSIQSVPDHHIRDNGILFNFDASAAARLDDLMADYMAHYTIPGASVAIIKDGEIVYHQDYGVTNWLTQDPVRPESLFDVGSITKPIFAFAVHRLVDQGVLELDRPLHEYLPFEDIANDDRARLFTARYVLSHQTGLPNWRWQNDDGQLDIAFTPGEGYRYSGEGYDYLGRVIEHITGEALEDVLMREAVAPLGMSDAVRFSKRGNWHELFVHGHSELRAFNNQTADEAHAAYSMMASTHDLAQVLRTWMQRGGGLSDAGYETMFEAQVDTDETAGGTSWRSYHAVGPRILKTPYGRAIGHSGLNWGQIALMEYYEDHDAGFVIATNGDDGMHLRDALRRFLVTGHVHPTGSSSDR